MFWGYSTVNPPWSATAEPCRLWSQENRTSADDLGGGASFHPILFSAPLQASPTVRVTLEMAGVYLHSNSLCKHLYA